VLGPKSGISDCLREGLVQTIAMVRLLIAGWFEPPRVGGLHASTLVQQILSIIAERGGVTAIELWSALASGGSPFEGVSKDDFVQLLRHMGERRLLAQDSSGLLLHGELGEKLVNHYEFYAAFTSEEEFRLVCEGKALGSLPVSRPLLPQQRIIFAGRRWRVLDVDTEKKLIVVMPDRGGAPPMFDGGGAMIHDRVRQEMRIVLSIEEPVQFLDPAARELLGEARNHYRQARLDHLQVIERGSDIQLLTWRGDWVNDALALLLARYRLVASNEGLLINVSGATKKRVLDALDEIGELESLDPVELLADAKNVLREKWDWALPDEMVRRSFASLCLDLEGARETARQLARSVVTDRVT